MEKPTKIRVLRKVLSELLGIEPKVKVETAAPVKMSSFKINSKEKDYFYDNIFISTKSELGRLSLADNLTSSNTVKSIHELFKPIHESIGAYTETLAKLEELAPEISSAKKIRVSSILAPNDLNYTGVQFDIKNTEYLAPEEKSAVVKYLTKLFNEELEFLTKTKLWVEKALYDVGSVCLFCVPSDTVSQLRDRGIVGAKESLDSIYSAKTTHQWWNKGKSYIAALESINVEQLATKYCSPTDNGKYKDLIKGLEQMKAKIVRDIQDHDLIRISDTPEIIKFSHDTYKYQKNKFNRDKTGTSKVAPSISYVPEYFLNFDDFIEEEQDPNAFAYYTEIPSEAVIPITLSTDPTHHLGYFVLVDEQGSPLRYTPNKPVQDVYHQSMLVNDSHLAVYGQGLMKLDASTEIKMKKDLFNNIFDCIIKKKLEDESLGSISVNELNKYTDMIFWRIIEKKRTGVIFVPTKYMTYIAFNYDPNTGVGVGLLKRVMFILSLRTTFLVAGIMGMADSAVPHTKIDVTFDDKITNYEQVLDMIMNTYIEKRRMRLSLDPADITRNIARNAITIAPKNMAGLQGFDIESNTSSSSAVVNTELLDALNNLLATALGVPYSALNQLSETEYSRSILTTNIIYTDQIREDQRILCYHLTDFIRKYIIYSPQVQQDLVSIISRVKAVNQDIKQISANEKKIKNYLKHIINNIYVQLPTPSLAADKAQFDQFKDYQTIINDTAEILFSEMNIPFDNQELSNTLKYVKAQWIKDMSVNLLNRIGLLHNTHIPSMEDVALQTNEWLKQLQSLYNLSAAFKHANAVFGSSEESSSYGGFGGSSEDEFSFGGEEESEESPEMTEETATTETTETTTTETEEPATEEGTEE